MQETGQSGNNLPNNLRIVTTERGAKVVLTYDAAKSWPLDVVEFANWLTAHPDKTGALGPDEVLELMDGGSPQAASVRAVARLGTAVALQVKDGRITVELNAQPNSGLALAFLTAAQLREQQPSGKPAQPTISQEVKDWVAENAEALVDSDEPLSLPEGLRSGVTPDVWYEHDGLQFRFMADKDFKLVVKGTWKKRRDRYHGRRK